MRRNKTTSRKSNKPARPNARRLQIEGLELRQMLSASTKFTPDYVKMSPLASGSTNSGYTPAQVRAAYGFSSTSFGSTPADGRGETIAIVDAYNDPTIKTDLAAFDTAYGIAAPPSFSVVNESGGSTLPTSDQGWSGEIALDVEWAHAIAPGANIVLVEANSDYDNDLFAAVNYARNLPNVVAISMSWGSQDTSSNASGDQQESAAYLVTPSGHQNITFTASTGDSSYASFPATSPNVLAIGGTDLYASSNGTYQSETAWADGGGGTSQEFSGRTVPDVSYNAGVGIAVLDTYGDGGWVSVGGTSAGSPQWAALVAIADEGRSLNGLSSLSTAQVRTALFAAPASDFHDITSGHTATQSAGVGYDLATGIGTPVANNLIPYLASYSTTGGGGTTTTTAPAAPGGLTANAVSSSQINLSWGTSTGATGYRVYEIVNGSATLLTTTSGTSFSVTGLAASTKYTFDVAAYNTAGSNTSGTVSATTLSAVAKVTTPNVTVTAASSSSAKVSWATVSGATGYYVYWWNGSQAVQVASLGASATSTTITGLASGTQYFYVTAYNSASTASSAWVSVVLPTSTTTTSTLTATGSATSSTTASMSWNAISGASGYAVYYWNGFQSVLLGWVSSSTTAVTISGLTPGSTWSFRVVASTGSTSIASNWVSITTPLSNAALQSLFAQSSTTNTAAWWRE